MSGYALWIAVFALALGTFAQSSNPDIEDFSIAFVEIYQCLVIFTCLAALSCLVNWRMVVRKRHRKFLTLLTVNGIILILGLNIRFQYEVSIDTDFDSSFVVFRDEIFWPSHWLFTLCFAIAIIDALDWRYMCAALASMLIISLTLSNQWSTIWDAFPFLVFEDGYAYWGEIPSVVSYAWVDFRDAICAVLLGAALQPLRISMMTEQSRMAKFLSAVLAVHFFIPGDYSGYPLIVSCVAFAGSLAWSIRGLIAGPFIILLCAIVSYGVSLEPRGIVDLGGLSIVFPAAFLGVLATRQLMPQLYSFRMKPAQALIFGVKS